MHCGLTPCYVENCWQAHPKLGVCAHCVRRLFLYSTGAGATECFWTAPTLRSFFLVYWQGRSAQCLRFNPKAALRILHKFPRRWLLHLLSRVTRLKPMPTQPHQLISLATQPRGKNLQSASNIVWTVQTSVGWGDQIHFPSWVVLERDATPFTVLFCDVLVFREVQKSLLLAQRRLLQGGN